MGRTRLAVICSVEDCEGTYRIVRGMCQTHYKRFMRKGHTNADKVTYVCEVEACGKPHSSNGYCDTHSRRFLKYGDPTLGGPIKKHMNTSEERFASNTVLRESGCLEWTGAVDGRGYGRMRHGRGTVAVHRYALMREGVDVPSNRVVDHRCHNPGCVLAAHLRVVTNKQNSEHVAGPSKRSTSGVLGVYWNKINKNWSVRVGHNGHCGYYGSFKDKGEAEKVAIDTRNKLFTHNDKDRI